MKARSFSRITALVWLTQTAGTIFAIALPSFGICVPRGMFPGVETPYSQDVPPGQRNVAAALSADQPTLFMTDAVKGISRPRRPTQGVFKNFDQGARTALSACFQRSWPITARTWLSALLLERTLRPAWKIYAASIFSGGAAVRASQFSKPIITAEQPSEGAAAGAAVSAGFTTQGHNWQLIAPFFQPPTEYAGRFGSYRSPLIFSDGTPVTSAADWSRRRAEILKQWHELMGPWPPVLQRPKLEVLSATHRDNFAQRRVRLEIASNQTGEGWLLVPDGPGPFPAALVVYYEPETSAGLSTNALRDFGYQLTRRGFVTLNIGTPGGNAWKPATGTAQCQPLSFHAYVAANCWHALANLPEIDRARIGVVGHSYGGKWALFAAALWDKFACVAVSDPGIVFDETRPNVNYWEPWYLGSDPAQKRPKAGLPTADNPRTGAYKRMIEAGRDLHELHALIAPRPFLVSGGAEDPPARWTALNHAVAVNHMLGFTNRVAMTNRKDHTPTEESNAQLYAFFEHFLGNGGRTQPNRP